MSKTRPISIYLISKIYCFDLFVYIYSNVNEKGGVGGLHSMAPSQRPAPFLRSRTLPSIIVPGSSFMIIKSNQQKIDI